ncbi:MAG: ammonia-forming cytochrome c nitrite reductase [Campylobacteraceae bacterium]|jgi:nitrite reductase (cytochrome c-552)|nr:ammonia-forming cytochrome c nitrite reductase [Campylobacteraceae bacterium]
MKKYILLLTVLIVVISILGFLSGDINAKEKERTILTDAKTQIDKPTFSSEWQKYYPRQHDSWKQTKNDSELRDMIKKWPQLAILWAGYPFSKDYNAPRGHYYSIQDNVNTLRVGAPTQENDSPLPTACWTCKSPDVVRLMETNGDLDFFTGKWNRWGGEIVNSIGCYDCHNPQTSQLKMGRDYLNKGLKDAGLKTFEDSTHQTKRDLVCAQCHSEYHFSPVKHGDDNEKTAMTVKLPWKDGLKATDMEKYYENGSNFADGKPFADFINAISKTPIIKAQHPDYELHLSGIHGKKGVSCADCHMPYTQEGSVKYSDHKVGNPLESMDRSCMTCHRESEAKLKSIVKEKYDRKEILFDISINNIAKAHLEAAKAWEVGATQDEMNEILHDIRIAQWRWDYVVASHGGFFHAPDESLFILGTSIDYAQKARLSLVSVLAKYGVFNYEAPDFSSKDKAQTLMSKYSGVNMDAEIEKKLNFKKTLEAEWKKLATQNGILDEKVRDYKDDVSSYFGNPK